MRINWFSSSLLVFLIETALPISAAPYVVGNRYFPPTPTTEDPFVSDEISLKVSQVRHGTTASESAHRETEAEFGIDKRITDDLGISIESSYKAIDYSTQSNKYGFDNVTATLTYQFYKNDDRELLLSAGIERMTGGTGASRIGAEDTGTTTPTFYFGKGFGDLPDGIKYLKPFAITGTVGYQFADVPAPSTPDLLTMGFSIQYSLRYMEGNVAYIGLPEWIDRIVPVIEFSYTTPTNSSSSVTTVGTVAPGFVYVGNNFDIGLEALVPATGQPKTDVGVIAMLHVRLGGALGQPLLSGSR